MALHLVVSLPGRLPVARALGVIVFLGFAVALLNPLVPSLMAHGLRGPIIIAGLLFAGFLLDVRRPGSVVAPVLLAVAVLLPSLGPLAAATGWGAGHLVFFTACEAYGLVVLADLVFAGGIPLMALGGRPEGSPLWRAAALRSLIVLPPVLVSSLLFPPAYWSMLLVALAAARQSYLSRQGFVVMERPVAALIGAMAAGIAMMLVSLQPGPAVLVLVVGLLLLGFARMVYRGGPALVPVVIALIAAVAMLSGGLTDFTQRSAALFFLMLYVAGSAALILPLRRPI